MEWIVPLLLGAIVIRFRRQLAQLNNSLMGSNDSAAQHGSVLVSSRLYLVAGLVLVAIGLALLVRSLI